MYKDLFMHTQIRSLTIEDGRADVRVKAQIAAARQEYPDIYSVIRTYQITIQRDARLRKWGYADISAVRRAASEKLPL